MRLLFVKNFLLFLLGICLLALAVGFGIYVLKQTHNPLLSGETATVIQGDVANIVTVTATIEAKNTARMTFSTIGTVKNVYKHEGDQVAQGEVLASLTQDSVVSDYNAAVQNLKYLESTRDELLRGPEATQRTVTRTSVQIAEQNVQRTAEEQARIVKNTHETLLSSGLEAIPESGTNDDTPPSITGNYLCPTEGSYIVSVFGSKSSTKYSYTLSGLEQGTFVAYTDVPKPLGTCGLFIQFDPTENYSNANWIVSVPNVRSSVYLTNLNTYKLALQQETNAVSAAKQALELAHHTEQSVNADPTQEALDKINANIEQAQALLKMKEALVADYTIRAPFNGTITDNTIKIGEAAAHDKQMTIIQEGQYDLKARIPEVNITNIHVGDHVHVSFDAKPKEDIEGTISYVSPDATQIDGVAYYEAKITLGTSPEWLRAGLNADVRVVVDQKKNVTRLSERFIITENGKKYVLVRGITGSTKTAVETGISSNDGYIEITSLPAGTTVVLP